MGIFSRFEDKMEDTVEGAASRMSKAPISPVQIAKRAEKAMRRQSMVGAGKEYAPTLYTVLVNPEDDARLFGYYPTLAGETETYLKAHADQAGLVMDGDPLVRFIVDESLRHGRFEVIAETVSAPIIAQLREEEMQHYGLAPINPAIASAIPVGPRGIPGIDSQPVGYNPPNPEPRGPKSGVIGGSAKGQGKAKAHLIDLSQNRPYNLTGTTMVLGRDNGCDIPVKDISASRHHAELTLSPQGLWIISDLNSTNGTIVNGKTIASQPLYVGDVITIGKTDFEFALV